MIYGNDKAMEMPVKDLYDSSMMIASINAAKDMYDKGIKLMEDFRKKYEDFYSPMSNDVTYWYNNTTKPVSDALNYMYAHGIDPTRSAEGRALMARVVNNAPVATLARLKQSAETGKIYQKAYGALEAEGKLDPVAERWFIELQYGPGTTFENWDTAKNGVWTRMSPSAKLSMFDIANPLVKDLTATLDEEKSNNDPEGMLWYTLPKQLGENALKLALPSIKKTPYGLYYYNQILEEVDGNEDSADNIFVDRLLANSGKQFGTYKVEPDEIKLTKLKSSLDLATDLKKIEAQGEKEKEVARYKAEHGYDGGNGGNSNADDNIFDYARVNGTGIYNYDPENKANQIHVNGKWLSDDISDAGLPIKSIKFDNSVRLLRDNKGVPDTSSRGRTLTPTGLKHSFTEQGEMFYENNTYWFKFRDNNTGEAFWIKGNRLFESHDSRSTNKK